MPDRPLTTELSMEWAESVRQFVPAFVGAHPVLGTFGGGVCALLHGSTTMGFADEASDIDLWLLLSPEDVATVDRELGTRFVEFKLDGKKGHLNAHDVGEFAQRARDCHMDTIYQLRLAVPIIDPCGVGQGLIDTARRPMSAETRNALFCYHYVEMRNEHRACVSPITRNHPVPLFLFLTKTVAHALRAAMVLDGEPYPYDKWLYSAAAQTETGGRLIPHVEHILDLLARDHLRTGGPEATHPITLALRAIRATLVEAARAKGLDAPWLSQWWLHMDQAAAGMAAVRWC